MYVPELRTVISGNAEPISLPLIVIEEICIVEPEPSEYPYNIAWKVPGSNINDCKIVYVKVIVVFADKDTGVGLEIIVCVVERVYVGGVGVLKYKNIPDPPGAPTGPV